MNVSITGRHVGVTASMKEYARAKVEKLLKFFDRATSAHVTMDMDHQNHTVEMALDLAKGARLVGKAEAPDMYAALDLAEEKLAHQLRRWKERLKDHHRGERSKGSPGRDGGEPESGGNAPAAEEQVTYEDVIEKMRRGE